MIGMLITPTSSSTEPARAAGGASPRVGAFSFEFGAPPPEEPKPERPKDLPTPFGLRTDGLRRLDAHPTGTVHVFFDEHRQPDYEIVEGVAPGEQVVVKGQRSLRHGQPVRVLDGDATATSAR